jgi:mono/diheme cytochrome c family protein
VAGIDTRLAEIEQERQALLTQMQPAIDRGYDPEQPSRLAALGWQGTLDSFIQTTLVHGRPTSESYWPQAMVAWSQRAGGPLRDDQIEDLSNYIINWDKGSDWTLDGLLSVQQFAIRPGLPGEEAAQIEPIGTNVEAILTELEGVTGDPLNGQTIYNNAPLACIGCHAVEAVAPLTANQWENINTVRLNEPQFAGYTPEQYLVESIVNPGHYIVPGYSNAMPADFGQRLDIQMLADIIAYIKSYE